MLDMSQVKWIGDSSLMLQSFELVWFMSVYYYFRQYPIIPTFWQWKTQTVIMN
jgi:hypothetical protein